MKTVWLNSGFLLTKTGVNIGLMPMGSDKNSDNDYIIRYNLQSHEQILDGRMLTNILVVYCEQGIKWISQNRQITYTGP
jgi:hypothetical protein